MAQPLAAQHAPCVFGQGFGLHGALAVKTEPKGQSDLVTKAHPPASPGMQHAPRDPPQGFGLQGVLGVKNPAMEAHSFRVAVMQALARLQHAPFGWHGAATQVVLTMNVLAGGQLAAVVSMQTLVAGLQHAPLGPQLAAAQDVLGNHEAEHSDLTTNTQAAALQHAPLGRHGDDAHDTPAVHVPAQEPWAMLVQSPLGEQQEPAMIALGQGLAVHEPAK